MFGFHNIIKSRLDANGCLLVIIAHGCLSYRFRGIRYDRDDAFFTPLLLCDLIAYSPRMFRELFGSLKLLLT